jgi:hypothetical protein
MADWLSAETGWGKKDPEILADEPNEKRAKRRSVALKEREKNTIYRRAFSETQLLDLVGLNWQDGDIYNVITAGDVDALSYLKLAIRQQNIDHLIMSTWCMAGDDILQIEEWIESGKIKKMDAYMGEIFPGTYGVEYSELKRVITPDIGRIAIFRNHSKIFAGKGEKFYFGIQTSANVNTNPRCENGSITIGKPIYEFYKEYFDGIVSFEK